MENNPSLAELAYEHWRLRMKEQRLDRGIAHVDEPIWSFLDPLQREAWVAAVEAIKPAIKGPQPAEGLDDCG